MALPATYLAIYDTQKIIGEQLLADYTRKGFLRGRALRLVSISVRPGRPNAAASGFMSGIIREPLAGQRATCPVDPGTEVALASPDKAIAGLRCAATASDQDWGGRSAVNLPALTISVAGMATALARVAGPEVSALIDWIPDPQVARMVASWPARVRADRAGQLGLTPDPDFDSIIGMHLAESRFRGLLHRRSDRDGGVPAVLSGDALVVEPHSSLGEVTEVQRAPRRNRHGRAPGLVRAPPERVGMRVPVVEAAHH